MTNPYDALSSFQSEFSHGNIKLERCSGHPDLYVHYESFENSFRLTYVRLDNTTVAAFVNVAPCAPIDKITCLQIGYAVPEQYRNRGLAKHTINLAIAEMQKGFRNAGIKTFYLEAIVGADNRPSQRVAEQVISSNPVEIIDAISGLPAFQYLKKIG